MPKPNAMALLNFKHRVILSKSFTEPLSDESTDIILVREKITEVWASIAPVRGAIYVNGIAIRESRNAYSHNVYIRYNRDLDITAYAWLYERRVSGSRWYKVTSVQEVNDKQRYWEIEVRLVQKGDDVNPPGEPNSRFAPLPDGVEL